MMIRKQLWCDLTKKSYSKIYSNNKNNNNNNNIRILNENNCEHNKNEKYKKEILSFNEIPSAKSLSLFGVNIDFILSGAAKQLHEFINKRHKKLGPIFREKMGPIEAVFLSSPDLMRKVFLYEGKYPKHPLPESWLLYNQHNNCKRGLFFMDNEEWLHYRKLMNSILLKNDINWINNIVDKQTNIFIDNLKQLAIDDKEFIIVPDILGKLYNWSVNVTVSLMFGKTYVPTDEFKNIINEFAKTVNRIFETSAHLMSAPPKWSMKLKSKKWLNFENSVHDTLELANNIIDYGLKNIDMNDDGILQEMIKLNITNDNIKRIFADLIIASGDTVAYTTQWALYLLANDNNIQHLVREEIFADLNNNEPSLVRGTIREALRLYPAATFIGRFIAADAVLGNYHIPNNTLVILSLYTSGRDDTNFPESNKYMPSRWQRNSNGKLSHVHQSHGSIPYALGSRSCIGRKMANYQMHIIIKKIMEQFQMKIFNEKPINVVMKMIAVPNQELKFGIKMIKQ